MSEQVSYFEDIREMFWETDRRMRERDAAFDQRMKEADQRTKEADQRMKETERQMKERDAAFDRRLRATNKLFSEFGLKIGKIVEHMIRGNMAGQFQALGYEVAEISRNHYFENKKLNISGEIDVVLYDGDVVILIEVKTTLETSDVRKHIERLKEYRIFTDAKPWKSNKRFVGAVAGAVVTDEALKFAHENGLYAIVQSGRAVEIVQSPEGFKAKEW
jgi:hypothetical protein